MDERGVDELSGGDRDYRADLGAAVAAYLSTLEAIGSCISESSGDVGRPFGARIQKLRTRVAFNPTSDAIRDSAEVIRGELMNFGTLSAMQFEQHALEFERSASAVQHLLQTMVRRNDYFLSRLQGVADELRSAARPQDQHQRQALASEQSESLLALCESIGRETKSHVQAVQEELSAASDRLADLHSCDPVTGLMTREEVLPRVEALRADEIIHTIVIIELSGEVNDVALRQVAAKLSAHFRHQDLIARWGDREFMVVFHGEPGLAEDRCSQVIPQIGGSHTLEDGRNAHWTAQMRIEQAVTTNF